MKTAHKIHIYMYRMAIRWWLAFMILITQAVNTLSVGIKNRTNNCEDKSSREFAPSAHTMLGRMINFTFTSYQL